MWNELGGLDEGYFPAYYEDVDFCLKIAERGSIVLYEPRSVVRHFESRSSTQRYKEYLCLTHRRKLLERWSNVFEGSTHAEPIDGDSVEEAIHLAMGSPPRVLLIDDRMPDSRLGSGYSRMFDVVREIAASRLSGLCLPDDRDHRRPRCARSFGCRGRDRAAGRAPQPTVERATRS